MNEKALEQSIKQWLREHGHFFFKVHGSEFMEAGLPDLIICSEGRFIGVEVKRPGKKNTQSELQKLQEHNILASGGVYLLVDNFDEFIKEMETLNKC